MNYSSLRSGVRVIATFTALLAAVACTGESREPVAVVPASSRAAITSLASTRQVMLGITAPASNVVFGVGENAPTSEAEWEQVQASAMSLAESANLLKIDGRRIEAEDWARYVDALIATASAAALAAQEKNVEEVLEVGNRIYEVCEACHKQYLAVAAAGGAG